MKITSTLIIVAILATFVEFLWQGWTTQNPVQALIRVLNDLAILLLVGVVHTLRNKDLQKEGQEYDPNTGRVE